MYKKLFLALMFFYIIILNSICDKTDEPVKWAIVQYEEITVFKDKKLTRKKEILKDLIVIGIIKYLKDYKSILIEHESGSKKVRGYIEDNLDQNSMFINKKEAVELSKKLSDIEKHIESILNNRIEKLKNKIRQTGTEDVIDYLSGNWKGTEKIIQNYSQKQGFNELYLDKENYELRCNFFYWTFDFELLIYDIIEFIPGKILKMKVYSPSGLTEELTEAEIKFKNNNEIVFSVDGKSLGKLIK